MLWYNRPAMFKVTQIIAREILDSRGNPTVEADCFLEDGSFGRAAVPSGASTGSHEALELRDGGARYLSLGVTQAVKNVNTALAGALVGQEWTQRELDSSLISLDGTPTKSRLGANAILSVSLSFAKATAVSEKRRLSDHFRSLAMPENPVRLPLPLMNLINGGKHAEGSTDIQEYMVVPLGAKNFREAVRYGSEIFHSLGLLMKEKGQSTLLGDEGGYAPHLSNNREALDLLVLAIERAGYTAGVDVALALDVAATELLENGSYHFKKEGRSLSTTELISYYEELIQNYPIVSIEDGMSEDDWAGHRELTERLGSRAQLVGDDLFATNTERLKRGIEEHSANAILIKPNQVGTLTETIDAITMAEHAGFSTIVSHRSGETEDTTISDFSVGLGVGQVKMGAPARGERTSKYNQLMRLEEYLEGITFAGRDALKLKNPS